MMARQVSKGQRAALGHVFCIKVLSPLFSTPSAAQVQGDHAPDLVTAGPILSCGYKGTCSAFGLSFQA